ncbi:hypothetical protein [Saccharopolyspora phatthalungensis]|uniref:Uncharacterized protein n=1 Tax=Saccharopolyspora phatthalungensis TaxID=664693 RepID=A0A840QHI4_9PSEU|nr:hypothetical protein [Saccharopolyspora phatthalungensis]MBB5159986.1 hypothetical protein [Saccharopolyspora phatthalungensis]
MSAADAGRSAVLAALSVKTAVKLEDLAESVRSGRTTNGDYLDMSRLLSELAALLRDRCTGYVPPRAVGPKQVEQ